MSGSTVIVHIYRTRIVYVRTRQQITARNKQKHVLAQERLENSLITPKNRKVTKYIRICICSSNSSIQRFAMKTLFVTVGTTLFNELINVTTSVDALKWMCLNGYTNLIVQYGNGSKPDLPEQYILKDDGIRNEMKKSPLNVSKVLHIELYTFKPSLKCDMIKANTIISHAGAGTVMEMLRLQKERIIVVINTILMDNHQVELATAMSNRQYIYVVSDPKLLLFAPCSGSSSSCTTTTTTTTTTTNGKENNTTVWDEMESFRSKPYGGGNEDDFPRILNNFFQFNTEDNNTKKD